jgi:hypothetical protein
MGAKERPGNRLPGRSFLFFPKTQGPRGKRIWNDCGQTEPMGKRTEYGPRHGNFEAAAGIPVIASLESMISNCGDPVDERCGH